MSDDQKCLACGKELPANFEELETCPACGTDLWDDDGGDDGNDDGFDVIDGKIIGAAVVAAVAGVALWAAVAIGLNREIGWLAWGIGGLIGFAVIKAGGVGPKPAILAAVLAFASIAGGRVVSTQQAIGHHIDTYFASSEFKDLWMEMESDGMDYVKLKEPVTDKVLNQFLVDHNYPVPDGAAEFSADDLAYARVQLVPDLELLASPGGYKQYIIQEREFMEKQVTLWEVLKEGLGAIDILFLFLGIGTAFKMVMGR